MADVLDKTALMERIDDDLEFLADSIEVYDRDRVKLLSQMRVALSRQDGRALRDATHILSGMARNFSAKPVLDAALKLEIMVEKGELVGVDKALESLEYETTRLKEALKGILRQTPSAGVGRRRTPDTIVGRSVRVITVDDQELVRSGIRSILLAFDDIELVGEAASGEEGLRLCDELRPDVVLMDVRMPNMGGVAATRAIRKKYLDTQVLVLTVYHSSDLVTGAVEAGAVGYVMKDSSRDELAGAIRAARQGRTILSPEAARDLVANSVPPSPRSGADLTERERQVLGMLTKGMRNNQIAQQINKSPFTVRHYVSEIISKLGANNRAEAAAIAVKLGLVD